MKRNLIYLTLIAALMAAAQVTAQTAPEAPAEIRPLRIETGFSKTVHILFPSPVTYIDIGSMDIIAGKADGAGNVVRVKDVYKRQLSIGCYGRFVAEDSIRRREDDEIIAAEPFNEPAE